MGFTLGPRAEASGYRLDARDTVGSTNAEANPVRVPFCARQLFGDLRRATSAGQVPAAQLIPLQRKRAERVLGGHGG